MSGRDVTLPSDAPTELLLDLHCKYLLKYGENEDDFEFAVTDFLRLSGVYWCVTAMDIMGKLELMKQEEIVKFTLDCFEQSTGGFRLQLTALKRPISLL